MTKQEIRMFIEAMKDVGYELTPEEVEEAYGGLTPLEAVDRHLHRGMQTFYTFVEEVVVKDLQAMGREEDAEAIKKHLGK